jgi:hypothetical protein
MTLSFSQTMKCFILRTKTHPKRAQRKLMLTWETMGRKLTSSSSPGCLRALLRRGDDDDFNNNIINF